MPRLRCTGTALLACAPCRRCVNPTCPLAASPTRTGPLARPSPAAAGYHPSRHPYHGAGATGVGAAADGGPPPPVLAAYGSALSGCLDHLDGFSGRQLAALFDVLAAVTGGAEGEGRGEAY